MDVMGNRHGSSFYTGGGSPPRLSYFAGGSPHAPDHGGASPRRGTSPYRGGGTGAASRSVTLVTPPQISAPPATAPLDNSGNGGPSSLLLEIRRKRLAAGNGPPPLERADSNRDGGSGASAASGAAAGSGGGGRLPPASPTGSMSGTTGGPVLVSSASVNGRPMVVGLGARKPNYDMVQVYDLLLMSWMRESLTPRMLECHAIALQEVAAEETPLAEIFNFYGQLGQVVWLDSRLTLNERQFVKLAGETGVPEGSTDDLREVFRKLSDKTEFASEAASNHPHPYINFEQFPEAVLRLAALRYEWRPPENLEDAEEELYFASPPFMPPNPRESQLGDGDEEPPPRPPETVFVQIVKAYLKDDLLVRARRFKTAGSTQAKSRSQLRTAPTGLWLSSKSLTAGI